MKIETEIDFKKYINMTYTLRLRNKTYIVSLFFLAVFFIVFITKQFEFNDPYTIPVVFIPIIIFALNILFEYSIYQMKYHPNKMDLTKTTYEFTHEKIKISNSAMSSELIWGYVSKVVELNKWIFIYYNEQNVYAIPKIDFGNNFQTFKVFLVVNNVISELRD